MPGSIKIDDGSGNYTILTNAGSLGSDKTLTIPNETGTAALTSDLKIKQIVIADADNSGSESTQAGFPVATSLTASITPSSTSSKILIVLNINKEDEFSSGGAVVNRDGKVGVNRNNTASEGSAANGTDLGYFITGRRLTGTSTAAASTFTAGAFIFKDEPNTTSATTYTFVHGILNTNIRSGWLNTSDYPNYIMLLEI
jgi:hypothetical protein